MMGHSDFSKTFDESIRREHEIAARLDPVLEIIILFLKKEPVEDRMQFLGKLTQHVVNLFKIVEREREYRAFLGRGRNLAIDLRINSSGVRVYRYEIDAEFKKIREILEDRLYKRNKGRPLNFEKTIASIELYITEKAQQYLEKMICSMKRLPKNTITSNKDIDKVLAAHGCDVSHTKKIVNEFIKWDWPLLREKHLQHNSSSPKNYYKHILSIIYLFEDYPDWMGRAIRLEANAIYWPTLDRLARKQTTFDNLVLAKESSEDYLDFYELYKISKNNDKEQFVEALYDSFLR